MSLEETPAAVTPTEPKIEDKPTPPPAPPKPRSLGHVDGVIGGVLHGWAIADPAVPAPVRIVAGERLIGIVQAGDVRNDVKAAGYPTAACGFRFDLNGYLDRLRPGTAFELSVHAGDDDQPIGRWKPDWKGDFGVVGRLTPATADSFTKLVLTTLENLRRAADSAWPDDYVTGDVPAATDAPAPWERLFEPSTIPETVRRIAGNGTKPAAGILDFMRYRMRGDQHFQPETYPRHRDLFLRWYLEHDSHQRGYLRSPLPKADVDYLNEVGNFPPASRAMSLFLPDHPDFKGLVQQGDTARLLYWWAMDMAPHLCVEDCLVPDWIASRLARIPGEDTGKVYPISQFMQFVIAADPRIHFLDQRKPADRFALYLYFVLFALSRPDVLRYMPVEYLRPLLSGRKLADGSTAAFPRLLREVTRLPETVIPDDIMAVNFARRLFDPSTLRFRTRTKGHRIASPAFALPDPSTTVDVQLIGPVEKASGLGQATRLSLSMLERSGRSVSAYDFGLDNPAPEGFSSQKKHGKLVRARVNLLHLNGESIPLAFAYTPNVYDGAYNIGYFFWELDSPANCHHLALQLLDEIWVSSEYCRKVFQAHTDKPVVNVGMCAEDVPEFAREESRELVRRYTGVPDETFVFLAAFDSFSFVQRKNPIGVIRAFQVAFPGRQDVCLLLKTHNRQRVQDPKQVQIWDVVDDAIRSDPRIRLIDETMPYEDIIRLKRGVDCYVSLHKSEGWGFGMLEAMSAGTPVIATAYSGNMDFCDDAVSWMVPWTEYCLAHDEYIFVVPGQKWAEPDVAAAARVMRTVIGSPEERAAKAEAARRKITSSFSEEAIARRYAARLDEIFAERS